MQLAGFRFVKNDKQIAADAVHGRLDDSHHGVGRDRRIHSVAAALEDLHARARRQRLTGRDNPVSRRHNRPSDDRPLGRRRLLGGHGIGEYS